MQVDTDVKLFSFAVDPFLKQPNCSGEKKIANTFHVTLSNILNRVSKHSLADSQTKRQSKDVRLEKVEFLCTDNLSIQMHKLEVELEEETSTHVKGRAAEL